MCYNLFIFKDLKNNYKQMEQEIERTTKKQKEYHHDRYQKVIEETTPSINLEDMTKVQLEEHGRTLGIELDRRKKKSDLIAEIETAQS